MDSRKSSEVDSRKKFLRESFLLELISFFINLTKMEWVKTKDSDQY